MDDAEYVRCDAKDCGARSYIFALLPSGNDLSFCGHHGTEARPKLEAMGALVADSRDEILK